MRWFHLERAAEHGQGLTKASEHLHHSVSSVAVHSAHPETAQSHSELHRVMVLIKPKIKDVSVI